MRDRLIELICEGMAYRCGAECRTPHKQFCKQCFEIADYLIANGVIVPPSKVGDMVDKFFSHNTVIALWYDDPTDKHYSNMLWRGMAWDIPESHKSLPFVKFMGIVAESIDKSDTLNIKVELTKEEAEQALRKEDGKNETQM